MSGTVRVPVGVFHEAEAEGGATTVICSDGSVWAQHFGGNGCDGWSEEPPIPGTLRARELFGGEGDTAAPLDDGLTECKAQARCEVVDCFDAKDPVSVVWVEADVVVVEERTVEGMVR